MCGDRRGAVAVHTGVRNDCGPSHHCTRGGPALPRGPSGWVPVRIVVSVAQLEQRTGSNLRAPQRSFFSVINVATTLAQAVGTTSRLAWDAAPGRFSVTLANAVVITFRLVWDAVQERFFIGVVITLAQAVLVISLLVRVAVSCSVKVVYTSMLAVGVTIKRAPHAPIQQARNSRLRRLRHSMLSQPRFFLLF